MTPGTTPQHVFTLSFKPPEGSKFTVVYAQGERYKEKVLLELQNERCQLEEQVLKVKLTQEETLKFSQTPVQKQGVLTIPPAWIQIGIKTPMGDVLWSDIIQTTVERLLKPGGGFGD